MAGFEKRYMLSYLLIIAVAIILVLLSVQTKNIVFIFLAPAALIVSNIIMIRFLFKLYKKTKEFQKGKRVFIVRESIFGAMTPNNKFFTVLAFLLLGLFLTWDEFGSPQIRYLLVVAIFFVVLLPANWEFFERGIKFRLRFIPWEDVERYEKRNGRILLVMKKSSLFDKFWKGDLSFNDKDKKVEKLLKKNIKDN